MLLVTVQKQVCVCALGFLSLRGPTAVIDSEGEDVFWKVKTFFPNGYLRVRVWLRGWNWVGVWYLVVKVKARFIQW